MNSVAFLQAMRRAGAKLGMRCSTHADALVIADYELGAATKALFRAGNTDDPEVRRMYLAHAETELADLIMQLRMVWLILGQGELDLEKLAYMGEMRWCETLRDLQAKRLPV